jgi:hypothetical protein
MYHTLWITSLLLFEVDRKIIVEKLGVSRVTVKKYSALIIPSAVLPESKPDRAFLETGESKSA